MGVNLALLTGVIFGGVAGGLLAYLVGRIHGRDIAQRDDDAAFVALLAERDDYRDNPRVPGPMAGVIRKRRWCGTCEHRENDNDHPKCMPCWSSVEREFPGLEARS